MTDDLAFTDPERALALSYVPAAARASVAALWRLDERLGAVLATTTEPAIGAIRLAWWREALIALDDAPAPAEPILGALARNVIPVVAGAELGKLAEGWGLLLDPRPDADTLMRYGSERGGMLFSATARLLGEDAPGMAAAGAGWALIDLAFHVRDAGLGERALAAGLQALGDRPGVMPPRLRALGMLAMLARRDAAAGLLQPRRQGAPARVARMLAYRLIGR